MKYLTLLFLFLLSACYSAKNPNENDIRKATFSNYFKKFKAISVPLRLRPDEELSNEHEGEFQDIITASADSIYLDSTFRILDQFRQVKCFGVLPDTLDCVHIIWLAPVGPGYAPCLVTFSKTGQVISTDWLGVRGCGPDPCFHCSTTIIIKKDYSFYAADSGFYEPCDERYHHIPGDTQIVVLSKTGVIKHNGKPEFTQMKQDTLK